MKTFFYFLVFISVVNTYSQVTISIKNMQYDTGGNIADCGTIDLGTNNSTNLHCNINLQKAYNNALGDCTVKVFTKRNTSSAEIEKYSVPMPMSFWWNDQQSGISTFQMSVPLTLYASDYDTSEGILYAKIIRNSDNLSYSTTCNYSIKKTLPPSFSLSPTSVSIACGDLSEKTFTVTPSNIPSGATVSYQWNYSGWTLVNSTATSQTLKPTSGTILPSNVKVTPVLNGVNYPQLTSVISRQSYNPSYFITGSNMICSATTTLYSIDNLPSGTIVSSWTSSNPNVATIAALNNYQATLTKVGSGSVTITAVVTNPCGQQKSITKGIWIGASNFYLERSEPVDNPNSSVKLI